MNAHSVARLKDLHPVVADRATKLAQMLATEGINIEITQGLRTYAEQDALYAQGRTAPGPVVTNAKGGESWHCFGLCFDCAPFIDGDLVPDWNSTHPAWGRIIAVGASVGLRDGISWKDEPHLQPAELPLSPGQNVRDAFESGGVSAAWLAAMGAQEG